jgi:hypothetical protein
MGSVSDTRATITTTNTTALLHSKKVGRELRETSRSCSVGVYDIRLEPFENISSLL